MPSSPTPASLGFRMPAEWEPQEAVWLSWPHNRQTWPGNFRPIPGVFAGIAAQISRHEKVRLNVAGRLQKRAPLAHRGGGRRHGERGNSTTTRRTTPGCRDHGPIFVRSRRTGRGGGHGLDLQRMGGQVPASSTWTTRFRAPSRRALGLRRFRNRMVLEGGSIDVNGAGLLLTTEGLRCLNPNRNPLLGKARDRAQPQGLPRGADRPLARRRGSSATTRTGMWTT